MRVLIVEDDTRVAHFVTQALNESGYVVDHCADGESGLARARQSAYDAAIVDVMLPKLDGLSLVESLRDRQSALPILILSARSAIEDRVEGLEKGGDDYLAKPFAMAELIARVHALLRRASHPGQASILTEGDLSLDLLKREATRSGRKIELQRRELALLEFLLRHRRRVVTKVMILEHIWNYAFDPQTNVVDVLVYRLRQKIDRDSEPKLIQTVRGSGYVLSAP